MQHASFICFSYIHSVTKNTQNEIAHCFPARFVGNPTQTSASPRWFSSRLHRKSLHAVRMLNFLYDTAEIVTCGPTQCLCVKDAFDFSHKEILDNVLVTQWFEFRPAQAALGENDDRKAKKPLNTSAV